MERRKTTGSLDKVWRYALGVAAFLLSCGIASATVIFTGSISVSASDPTQAGRLSRSGIPQNWAGDEPFVGLINTGSSYHYTTIDLDLSSLEAGFVFGGFIQINFDSPSTTTFLSAYLGSYDPTDPGATWIGDSGFSGNPFGNPGFFQIVAGAGDHLILVLNETTPGGGLDMSGNLLIEAFSDTEFTDLVRSTAPEPGTPGMLLLGLAVLMAVRRSSARAARNLRS
jgi:hypothetical protein